MSDAAPAQPTLPTLRKPGRVPAHWVFRPYFAAWAIALGATIALGVTRMPALTPYVACLYACAAFFGHGYTIAWRTGSRLWRVVAWGIAASLHLVLIWLQADHAGARVVHGAAMVATRPPEPRLFVPIALNALALLTLTLHLVWLGRGDREPTDDERAAMVKPRRMAGARLTRPLEPITVPDAPDPNGPDAKAPPEPTTET